MLDNIEKVVNIILNVVSTIAIIIALLKKDNNDNR